MYDENIDVTRLVNAAHQMRNRVIAELFRNAFRKMREAVRNAAPGIKRTHAA
ncbi:RSP_7527 family protein [Pseudazoarcus pumilus]|uniref:RSP_7527 family protein n=1 Tax=Pseudazoarcus pumilus TaxID=2067960 RepID=UPI0013DABBF0|nr:hypothetical protein [Pseudazoarcus pumilus]